MTMINNCLIIHHTHAQSVVINTILTFGYDRGGSGGGSASEVTLLVTLTVLLPSLSSSMTEYYRDGVTMGNQSRVCMSLSHEAAIHYTQVHSTA